MTAPFLYAVSVLPETASFITSPVLQVTDERSRI
jgi:hypothetical protein